MDYHGRIMNIECVVPTSVIWPTSYKFGHRDARHAAAEIALEAQAEIARLRKALEFIARRPVSRGEKISIHAARSVARAALVPAAEVSGG